MKRTARITITCHTDIVYRYRHFLSRLSIRIRNLSLGIVLGCLGLSSNVLAVPNTRISAYEKEVASKLAEEYQKEQTVLLAQRSLQSILQDNQQRALQAKEAFEKIWAKKKERGTPIISQVWAIAQEENYAQKKGRAWALQKGLDACAGKMAGIGIAAGLPAAVAGIAVAIVCPPCIGKAFLALTGSLAALKELIAIVPAAVASASTAGVGSAGLSAQLAAIATAASANISAVSSIAYTAGITALTTAASSLPQQLLPPPSKLGPTAKCYWQVMALLKLALYKLPKQPYAPYAYLLFENHTNYIIKVTFDRAVAPNTAEAKYTIFLDPQQKDILYGIGGSHLRSIKFEPIQKFSTAPRGGSPEGGSPEGVAPEVPFKIETASELPLPVYAKRPAFGLAPAVNEVIATKIKTIPQANGRESLMLYDTKGITQSDTVRQKKRDDVLREKMKAIEKNENATFDDIKKAVNAANDLLPVPQIAEKDMDTLSRLVSDYMTMASIWPAFVQMEEKLSAYQNGASFVHTKVELQKVRAITRTSSKRASIPTVLDAVRDLLVRFNSEEQETMMDCPAIATIRNAAPIRAKGMIDTLFPDVLQDISQAISTLDTLKPDYIQTKQYVLFMKKQLRNIQVVMTRIRDSVQQIINFMPATCTARQTASY